MNITLEEKLLREILKHPQYIIDNGKSKKARAYNMLSKRGYVNRKEVSRYTQLCEYTIKRNGVRRLNRWLKKDNDVISFGDMNKHSIKTLMLTIFIWILIGLSIATIMTSFMFGMPNLANASLMIGFYAVLMIVFVAMLPSQPNY